MKPCRTETFYTVAFEIYMKLRKLCTLFSVNWGKQMSLLDYSGGTTLVNLEVVPWKHNLRTAAPMFCLQSSIRMHCVLHTPQGFQLRTRQGYGRFTARLDVDPEQCFDFSCRYIEREGGEGLLLHQYVRRCLTR
jgi:hypothetical protein